MKKLIFVLVVLSSAGCVFQDSPSVPETETNNTENNATNNNGSNNTVATNNTTNNATNNETNNSTVINPTNNATNNVAVPDCDPPPLFCVGFAQCGSGTIPIQGQGTCRFRCGTCDTGQCLADAQVCTSGLDISNVETAGLIRDVALSNIDAYVLWDSGVVARSTPSGFQPIQLVTDGSAGGFESISASATRWLVANNPDAATVVIVDLLNTNNEHQLLTGKEGSGFATSIALASYEKEPNEQVDRGVGIFGTPGADQAANIFYKVPGAEWEVGLNLLTTLPNERADVQEFGKGVSISPRGNIALVRSTSGVDVFALPSDPAAALEWTHRGLITATQEDFGRAMMVSNEAIVIASEHTINIYPLIDANGFFEVSPNPVVLDEPNANIFNVGIGSGQNQSFVVAHDRNRVLIWQSDGPQWIKTNTITDGMVGFTSLAAVDAGILDFPANFGRFPSLVLGGTNESGNKLRVLPLVPSIKPD